LEIGAGKKEFVEYLLRSEAGACPGAGKEE
jgi:hypothetical protein